MARLHSCWSPPTTVATAPPPNLTQMHLCRLIRFVLLTPPQPPSLTKPLAPAPQLYFIPAFVSLHIFMSLSVAFKLTPSPFLFLFSWGSTCLTRQTASSCTARSRWRHVLTRQWSSTGLDLCRKQASAPGWRSHLSRNSSCCRPKEERVFKLFLFLRKNPLLRTFLPCKSHSRLSPPLSTQCKHQEVNWTGLKREDTRIDGLSLQLAFL